jgi:flavin reductase (DIM6/NTAB) family NADH-FMN oxidoreductase RutF/AcrR family transcriptional regulator
MTAPSATEGVSSPNGTDGAVDSGRFRHVLGHFPTGIAVITADGPSGPAGMVVSSFTSVSLEPPLVAFLPDKSSTSWPAIRAAGSFCVNILSAGQEQLCAQFARKGGDKFAGTAWSAAPSGAPVLDGVMAWIDCELTQTFESGDHYIAIGRVLQLEAAEIGAPLVFFQGGYQHLETLSAAEDVMGQRPAMAGVTLTELARQTGTDIGTLSRYATSTEGLVDEIVGPYARAFYDECVEISRRSASARETVAELLRVAFESMAKNRVAVMILQTERPYLNDRDEFGYLEPLEREIDAIWHATLQRGIDEGEFRADVDVALAYRFIRDILFTAARWWISVGTQPSDDAISRADAYQAFILHGLLG